MNTPSPCKWILPSILIITTMFTAGCTRKSAHYSASNVGDSCYAKALPTVGEGGLAWGASLSAARKKSLDNCMRYAGSSGGTPNTCQVVLAKCK